jgi:hypothetical protein
VAPTFLEAIFRMMEHNDVSHRRFFRAAATVTTAVSLVLAIGGSASATPTPPAAATMSASESSAAVIALEARSAAIPVQPIQSSESIQPIPMNEPVWTRTCERGYGMEIWNNLDPMNCMGTMSYYYYNVVKYSFNMLAFLATYQVRDPNALINYLDAWCNTHSFQCNAVWFAASIGASFIFL